MSGDFFWRPHPLASLFLLMQIWALYCYVHLRRCPLFSWGCNSGLWKPDTNASTEAALPWETHQVISNFWIMVHSSQSDITVFWINRKWLFEHEIEVKILKHDFPKMRGDQRPFGTFPNYSSFLETPSVPQHTDPELQAIVQGLEVSSPWFRAIFWVLFCDYDVSQGLRG